MNEEKQAELYTSPGGKFVRSDSLRRMLAHWHSFRLSQKQAHFIKYDGELYTGDEVQKLTLMSAAHKNPSDPPPFPEESM